MASSDQREDRGVALVTSSHGLSGRAVYEHLHGRPGWEVTGASRRAEPPVAGAPHSAVNLADRAATRDALAGCGPTRLFFGAYINAAVALTRALLPAMVARGGGHVVNIGSAAAVADFGEQLACAVSKAALERFTTGLATELSATGIRVNCVRVDEALRTEALAALIGDPQPGCRGVTPAEFGAAVRWITRQPASFTGHVLTFQRLRELGALPAHDTGGVR